MINWTKYIDTTKNKPPRKLLVQALDFSKNRGAALDLGAGALNDSRYLLEAGFKKVVAIDGQEDLELINQINNKAFVFKKNLIQDYDFPVEYFDLINAQFVLPFIEKEAIKKVVNDIKKSLKKGGIFLGQFFGEKDSWNGRAGVYAYTEKEVRGLLSGVDIVNFQEEEKDGPTAADGNKHWHIFHFIVKRI